MSAMKKQMYVPTEFKAEEEPGAFSGLASVFGNVDLGGDIISKNEPFKEFVLTPSGKVLTLFMHDSGGGWGATGSGGLPIGLADVKQTKKGLEFKGQLVMDDPFVQRVHTHMKAGTLTGMSIGYDILPGGGVMKESGVRELSALKLWEISVVVWGMNPKAGIDSVKMAEQITTIREFEDFLRDAGGFSKSQAVAIACGGWKSLNDRRDSGTTEDATKYLEFLQSIAKD